MMPSAERKLIVDEVTQVASREPKEIQSVSDGIFKEQLGDLVFVSTSAQGNGKVGNSSLPRFTEIEFSALRGDDLIKLGQVYVDNDGDIFGLRIAGPGNRVWERTAIDLLEDTVEIFNASSGKFVTTDLPHGESERFLSEADRTIERLKALVFPR